MAEQKEKEAKAKVERLERTKVRNEAYKAKHGHYPIPTVVLSPNHPEKNRSL